MNDPRLQFNVRPMALQDVEQVSAIDRLSFATPWSTNSYRYEVTQNQAAHYYVAVPRSSPPSIVVGNGWLGRVRRWIAGPAPSEFIVGYGGFWMMVDEAHISTIAVRPEYRRRGIGELLLVTMIEAATALKATEVTLEVRESNHGAQQLYVKYGFEPSGYRRAYYTDNREDALIMTAAGVQAPAYRRKLAELKSRLYERLAVPASS